MVKRVPIANPIAVRRFCVAGEPGREVVLTIGKPRPDRDPSGDWVCSVLIDGIANPRRRRVHGIDALQALQLAIEYARCTLDALGLALVWLDENEPGYVGISRIVPGGWGRSFEMRMEQYLDAQSKQFAKAATAKGRRASKKGRRASKKGGG